MGQQPNYEKTTVYKDSTATSISNPQPQQAVKQVTYLDNLGRPIQQAALKQSPTGKDIVTNIGYDDLGRQTREYLPYVLASSGACNVSDVLADNYFIIHQQIIKNL